MEGLRPAQDNVEASAAAMAPVCAADRRDVRRVPGRSQPIMDRRTDPAPLKGRVAGPRVAGNQEQNAVTCRDLSLKRAIDRLPGPVQAVPVQV